MSTLDAKIAAILACDSLFGTYQVAVTPEEGLELAKRLPPRGTLDASRLALLVREINSMVPALAFGPSDRLSGQLGHSYQIGAAKGRLIIVDLFAGYWPNSADEDSVTDRITALAERAGAHVTIEHEDQTAVFSIRMQWDGRTP